MLEHLSNILHNISDLPVALAIVIIICSLIAWLAYIVKDRLKELAELRRVVTSNDNILPSGDTKCILCKYQVAESVKQAYTTIRDMQLELLDRQMKSVENMGTRVTRIFETEYLEFLKKQRPDMVFDVRGWEMRLVSEKIKRAFYQHLIPGIRQMLKENHLAQRTDMEFEKYKQLSIDTMKAGIMAFVEVEYIEQYSLSREVKAKFFALGYDNVLAPAINAELDYSRRLAKIYETDIKIITDKIQDSLDSKQKPVI